MALVLANGYPVSDETSMAVLYWPSEEAAQAWIDARPNRTLAQQKAKNRLYVVPLQEAGK